MTAAPSWWLALLLTLSFTLATRLQVWFQNWSGNRTQSADVISVLLGDARRLLANQFMTEADIYFHSGYYPSIFDNVGMPKKLHVSEGEAHHEADGHTGHEDMPNFLGEPTDWINRFGRHFFPSSHSHLEHPREMREILPWLRLSAELDPNRSETYTTTAFWMRTRLGLVEGAETFLREGWRRNPTSYAILFELGRLYDENRHDIPRARHVLEAALDQWQRQETAKTEPDTFALAQILARLAQLEERAGDSSKAILYFQKLQAISPNPRSVQARIDELKAKLPTR